MKKNSTLFTTLNDSVGVRNCCKTLHPRQSTVMKLCQLARSAFYVNPALPVVILN